MKNRSMLKNINLEASIDMDLVDRMTETEARIKAQDQAVIDYLNIRGLDRDFRNRVKEAINKNKTRRGPKPDGLAPIAFFELIKAIKKSYKLKNIGLALETYCELHNLPLEKASSFEDKYRRGREENAKKKGGY
jgi:hypothetical protein